MKTSYYELTPKEKLALTEFQLQELVNLELAINGLHEPMKPPEKPEPPISIHKTEWIKHRDSGMLFKTQKDLEKFLTIAPLKRDYRYELGYNFEFASPISKDFEIVEYYNREFLDNNFEVLKPYSRQLREYEDLKAKYDTFKNNKNSIIRKINDDLQALREAKLAKDSMLFTWEEYKIIAEDNEEVAWKFMKKAFHDDQLKELFPDKFEQVEE